MLQQNLFISAPTLSQVAARVALGQREYSEAQKAGYAANRHVLGAGLERLGLVGAGEPDGAFYAYVDVSRFTNDSLAFCRAMLNEAGVAATPGVDFDRVNGDRFVRFSFAGSEATMHEALQRLERWLPRS
jgi:aspartate/methionine/tyrosine aminotransferase